MLPFGSNNKKILIGTQEKGFWTYDPGSGPTLFRKFNIEDSDLLEKAEWCYYN
jgi:hypothetical protein